MRRGLIVTFSMLLAFEARNVTAQPMPTARASTSHARAEAVLADIVGRLSADDRARTVGVYVAFDSSKADAIAQAACDDDGDYVLVLSDAMLDLVDRVAMASSIHALADDPVLVNYDAALATSQVEGMPLLPLPAGTYERFADDRAVLATMANRAWIEAIRYLIGAELSHGVSGRLVCPHPTATRESGDDDWTSAERNAATQAAAALYNVANVERADERSLSWMFDAGAREDGALVLLGAIAALSTKSSYGRLHALSLGRATALSTWATDWRSRNVRGRTSAL